ncbi:hypothetical protein THAOC_22722, partial [Thalassiosira oceanica]
MVSSALLGGTVLLLCGSAAVRCVSALQVSEETGRLLHGRVLGEESSSAVLDREPTDWWTRLFSGEGTAAAPENRRSHSATVYRYETDEDEMIEYMIISGGFTDQDWKTFP